VGVLYVITLFTCGLLRALQQVMCHGLYRGEIHTISEVNDNDKAEELTYEILKLLEDDFIDAHHVDAVLDRIPDLSLEVEVHCWQGLKKHIKGINEQIQLLEDCIFMLGMDQQSCQQRLQNAECKGCSSSIGGDG
jgi:hypothetical protein